MGKSSGVAALDQGAEGSAKAGIRPIRHPTRGGLGGDDEPHPTLGAAHVERAELVAAPVPGQVEGGQDDAVSECQLAVDREGIEEHGSFSSARGACWVFSIAEPRGEVNSRIGIERG